MTVKLIFGWLKVKVIVFFILCQVDGIGQSISGYDSLSLPAYWFNQGTISLINREWEPALLAYRNALQYSSGELQQAKIHQNLGSLNFLMADYEKAAIHYEYAFHLLEATTTDSEQLTEICFNLGFTFVERGELKRAMRWLELADNFKPAEPGLWYLRLALSAGNIFFSQGESRKAVEIFRKAIDYCSSARIVVPEEVSLRKNLARSYQALGQLDSAKLVLDLAIFRIRSSNTRDSSSIPEILLQKGCVMGFSGECEDAQRTFEEALYLINSKNSNSEDPTSISDRLDHEDLLMYKILYEWLSIEWKLIRLSNIQSTDIRCLYETARQVLRLGERLLVNNVLRESMLMEPGIQRSLTGIALDMILSMDGDYKWQANEAIPLTEKLTAFERISNSCNGYEKPFDNDTLEENHIGLKNQLFRFHKQQYSEDSDILIPGEKIVTERAGILSRLYEYDSKRLQASVDFISINPIPTSTDSDCVSALHTLIQGDEALIRYLIADSFLFTVLCTKDTLVIHKEKIAKEIVTNAGNYITALKTLNFRACNQYGKELYRQLILPIERELSGKFKLQIIPDKLLLSIPFDALIINAPEREVPSDSFLIYRYEIACYNSISAWIKGHTDAADPTGLRSFRYEFGGYAPDFSGEDIVSLPHAIHEVEQIARLFRLRNKGVRTMTGKMLCRDSLFSLGGQSRILHLATHADRDLRHPEFSGWMLPGDPSPSPNMNVSENKLEMGALQTIQLESDLLVLSSCSIGTDSPKYWYRMTGFPDNFFQAGVDQVLFSLWDVSDKHTDEFMNSFYRNYLEGKSYSAAIRSAKLQMLSIPETSFPTIWAVFVMLAGRPINP